MSWKKMPGEVAKKYNADLLFEPEDQSTFLRLLINFKHHVKLMVVCNPNAGTQTIKRFELILKAIRTCKVFNGIHSYLDYENEIVINGQDIKDIKRFLAAIHQYSPFDNGEREEIAKLLSIEPLKLLEEAAEALEVKSSINQTLQCLSLKSCKQLPHLIFAITHDDPATFQVLEEILPLLKGSYSFYFDEAAQEIKIQDCIWSLTKDIKEFETLKANFVEKGWNIFNAEHQRQYIDSVICNDSFDYHYQIETLASYRAANKAYSSFLRALPVYDVNYQAIDDSAACLSLTSASNFESFDQALLATLPIRDACMANNYLNTHGCAFGTVGIGHIEGIQREILKKQPKLALSNFRFFYIYSIQDIKDENELPPHLIEIDASKKTRSEIIAKIRAAIKQAPADINNNNILLKPNPAVTQLGDELLQLTYTYGRQDKYKTNLLGLETQCKKRYKTVPLKTPLFQTDLALLPQPKAPKFIALVRSILRKNPNYFCKTMSEFDDNFVYIKLFDTNDNAWKTYQVEKTKVVEDSLTKSAYLVFNHFTQKNEDLNWFKLLEKALILKAMQDQQTSANCVTLINRFIAYHDKLNKSVLTYDDIISATFTAAELYRTLLGCQAGTLCFKTYNLPYGISDLEEKADIELFIKDRLIQKELMLVSFLHDFDNVSSDMLYEIVDLNYKENQAYIVLHDPSSQADKVISIKLEMFKENFFSIDYTKSSYGTTSPTLLPIRDNAPLAINPVSYCR